MKATIRIKANGQYAVLADRTDGYDRGYAAYVEGRLDVNGPPYWYCYRCRSSGGCSDIDAVMEFRELAGLPRSPAARGPDDR